MKEKEETSDCTQRGQYHKNAGRRYGEWQKGTQAFRPGSVRFAHGTSVLSIAGQQEAGQQKTEDRAYVSNVTGLESTRNNSSKSVAYRVAKARSCRISSTALMAASSSSSFV